MSIFTKLVKKTENVSCNYSGSNVRQQVMCRVSFRGARGGHLPPPWIISAPPLEFERAKLLDMSSRSAKPQETLAVSLGKHDINFNI